MSCHKDTERATDMAGNEQPTDTINILVVVDGETKAERYAAIETIKQGDLAHYKGDIEAYIHEVYGESDVVYYRAFNGKIPIIVYGEFSEDANNYIKMVKD